MVMFNSYVKLPEGNSLEIRLMIRVMGQQLGGGTL